MWLINVIWAKLNSKQNARLTCGLWLLIISPTGLPSAVHCELTCSCGAAQQSGRATDIIQLLSLCLCSLLFAHVFQLL